MPNPNVPEISLKVYPRGFLGKQLEIRLASKRRSFDSQFSGLPIKVNLITPSTNVVEANATVEALYGRWINRAPETLSFEYRKQVLNAALDAFGTNNFFHWYTTQFASPAFADLHSGFLEDTTKFIVTGRRDMCLENWMALLTTDDQGERVEQLSPTAKEFFGIPTPDAQWRTPEHRELAKVIQHWLMQPMGFEDLLGTLHVLFGNY